MSEPWTIGRVSTWTARDLAGRGIEGARLDAELLVAHALGLRRIDLYLRIEQPLDEAELAKIRGLVERRRKREPVAYILGHRDFYNRRFAVDARALVPRPETELVVEAALARIKQNVYGTCLECGVPIPLSRLDAYPAKALPPGTSKNKAKATAIQHGSLSPSPVFRRSEWEGFSGVGLDTWPTGYHSGDSG